MKRKSEILFLGLFFFLAGCGAGTEDSQDRIEHDVIEWEDIQGGADLESGTEESMTEAESQSEMNGTRQIAYDVPLTEAAEQIGRVYALETQAFLYFGELEDLPREETAEAVIYLAKGNRILFLLERQANAGILIGNEVYPAYYSAQESCYLFYTVENWNLEEGGVPVNCTESGWLTYCTVGSGEGGCDYRLDDLLWFGKTQITFDAHATEIAQSFDTAGNPYIDAAVAYVSDTLCQAEAYGSYDIYIDKMSRSKSKGWDHYTNCSIVCAIAGDGRVEYAYLTIGDSGNIGKSAHPETGTGRILADSPGYFSDCTDWQNETAMEIMQTARSVVHLEVTEETQQDDGEETPYHMPDENWQIDFRKMSAREIAELVTYVCSYSEWFGMYELGCATGEVRGLRNQEIYMYTWEDTGKFLYFIPTDKANAVLKREDGKEYPVYINENGFLEFYELEQNDYVGNAAQMETSLITSCYFETYLVDSLLELGRGTIGDAALSELGVPDVEEDEYVLAFKGQVEDLLTQAGKQGAYDIQIGEYEVFCTNKVCISAAVTGEQDYYIRYLIVRYDGDNYYFWPVGFGLDGSLEECESTRHHMNEVCIDRTKLLNRNKMEINIWRVRRTGMFYTRSGGSWYIEDLDSANGTRIQRGGEGKKYRVSSRESCRVEKNDVIYLGLAPIKIR